MGWREAEEACNVGVRGAFGEPIHYIPASGAAEYDLSAPYSEIYESFDSETGQVVTTTAPNLLVMRSDMAADPVQGDRFVARGKLYQVDDPRSDSDGTLLLIASEVGPAP